MRTAPTPASDPGRGAPLRCAAPGHWTEVRGAQPGGRGQTPGGGGGPAGREALTDALEQPLGLVSPPDPEEVDGAGR